MKILMDLLAIQSEGSRGRGIGRYSEELSLKILEKSSLTINILLNSLYSEYDEEIESEFKKISKNIDFYKYDILDLDKRAFDERAKYNTLNSLLLQKQFLSYGKIDIIHFHSVFEGLSGKSDIVKNFAYLENVKSVITLYDLIPLIFKDIYLNNTDVEKWYFNRLRLCYESDMLLAISDATKEDAINILGIPENRVVNISGAIDENKFYKMNFQDKKIAIKTLEKFKISEAYLMYTGGIDFRKNIEASIKAYAKLDKNIIENYQYVIVCKIDDTQREHFQYIIKELKIPDGKIILTGFVSDEELNDLYNLCSLFIFPSIYEGFGLPVLEAMSCGAAVVGSNVSSIPEIIGREDCLFDPTNIDDITSKISDMLNNKSLQKELKEYFYKRSKMFTWDETAKRTIDSYDKVFNIKKEIIKKIKVAFFTPLPNKKSGISDYSLELLPFLTKYMDIDIYVDDYEVESDYLQNNFTIKSYLEFEENSKQYEQMIYQFGNSEFHVYMYEIALKYPGIIVLHDFFLSGLVNYISHINNDIQFLHDNLVYSHEKIGEEYYNKTMSSEISILDTVKDLPINKQIIDSADAIIVHSEYAKQLFTKYYDKSYNIRVINQLIQTPSRKALTKKETHKESLGFSSDSIIITAFGHIAETKQYDFILEAMHEGNIFNNKKVTLNFVGKFITDEYKEIINKLIKKYKLKNRVKITGFVTDEIYKQYLLASDIGINLRMDSRGETSRALLMNMAYGLPTIINDYASFSELPNNATCKIELESQLQMIDQLKLLIDSDMYRNEIARNSYDYILAEHNIDNIAMDYYQYVSQYCNQGRKEKNIIEEISDVIIENELNESITDDEYHEISKIVKSIVGS